MHCACFKLKGSSSCIGACRIRDACLNLVNAIDMKLKEGCIQALIDITREYNTLYHRLNIVIMIEQEIVSRGV